MHLWIELSQTVIRSPVFFFPQTVSWCKSWRRYQKFLLLWEFTFDNTPLVTDSFLPRGLSCSFSSSVKTELLTPIRDCSVNIELNYWSMIRNKTSVFEASELKCMVSPAILLFQYSTTKSTDTLEHWMTVCLGIFAYSLTSSGFEKQIPSFPRLDQSMSLNIDMKTIQPVNSSGLMFRSCKLFWISWRICNDVNPGKYSTRIQLVLHWFLSILCKKRTSWILPLDLPNFQLHLCYHSFSPDTVRNRSRQVLLPLPTGSLDHETKLISSSMERCYHRIPLLTHRQFINSCLSRSICYFATRSPQIFNFLAIFCQIFSEEAIFLICTSPSCLFLSLWAWSAHWFACCSGYRWNSNSWLISQRAISEFLFSQYLTSTSASAS